MIMPKYKILTKFPSGKDLLGDRRTLYIRKFSKKKNVLVYFSIQNDTGNKKGSKMLWHSKD